MSTTVFAGDARTDASLFAVARRVTPSEIGSTQLAGALESGLWNSNRTAVAISIAQPKASVVLVFVRQEQGTFLPVDVSRVEAGLFGMLGRPRADYDRFETTPVEWVIRTDGRFLVRMRTRAWRGGQRYTVSDLLLIGADGTVFWR
jgi:hypothetical protein